MLKYGLIAAALLAATSTMAETLTVQATDAIHGAGLGGNGPSTAPQLFNFGAGAGQILRFRSVAGSTDCCSGSPQIGADGGSNTDSGTTNIAGANGISGIAAPVQMFLVGVFVNSHRLPVAGSEPAARTYDAADLDNRRYRTRVNQAFFIGDGLTGTDTGAHQKFVIPRRADTLLLGFVDGFAFQGSPSYFGDNVGSLTARFNIITPPAAKDSARTADKDAAPAAKTQRRSAGTAASKEQKHGGKDSKKSR